MQEAQAEPGEFGTTGDDVPARVRCCIAGCGPAGAMLALLTVGAEGRDSETRAAAGLRVIATSPPMDVLWFRLSRRSGEPQAVAMRVGTGTAGILIDRNSYWQIAYVIPKGGADRVRAAGLDAFRRGVAALIPDLADRVDELRDWDQVKLLTVRSDRLARWWRPGYLAIGDAAHAMSPVAGVGINLAVQDAVEAANVLWKPLRSGRVADADLAAVQHRRELPTRLVQAGQSLIQRVFIRSVLAARRPLRMPRLVQVLLRAPVIRDVPPRLVAFGVGRPHVHVPVRPPAGDIGTAAALPSRGRSIRAHPWIPRLAGLLTILMAAALFARIRVAPQR